MAYTVANVFLQCFDMKAIPVCKKQCLLSSNVYFQNGWMKKTGGVGTG